MSECVLKTLACRGLRVGCLGIQEGGRGIHAISHPPADENRDLLSLYVTSPSKTKDVCHSWVVVPHTLAAQHPSDPLRRPQSSVTPRVKM